MHATLPRGFLAAAFAFASLVCLFLTACAGTGPRNQGTAVLHGPGKSQGLLRVREANGGVHIRGHVMGLTPGPYALYIHPSATCPSARKPDAKSLVGPLLLFRTDARGTARIDMVTTELQGPEGGGKAVLGRSLVLEKAFTANDSMIQMAACGSVD